MRLRQGDAKHHATSMFDISIISLAEAGLATGSYSQLSFGFYLFPERVPVVHLSRGFRWVKVVAVMMAAAVVMAAVGVVFCYVHS
jgi:hypothetical protein